jgi:hypothetical protein
MTFEFAKYPDGTLGVFSNIGKKENGEEYLTITFERPMEYGFDTYVIELPSYKVVLEDGNYLEEEKKKFMKIVKNGSSFFFKYARLGGLKIA